MRNWIRNNWGHLLGISLLAASTLALVHVFFLPVFVSDEIAFFIWSDHRLLPEASVWSPLFRVNGAGYGSSYWTAYINLINVFGDQAIWIMRAVACLVFISIPVLISLVGNRASKYMGYLLTALWLTMPIAWWTGKVTGPETFALGLGVYGVLLIYVETHLSTNLSERTAWILSILGWISIGGAVSLKLTMAPIAVFAVLIRSASPKPDESLDYRQTFFRTLTATAWMTVGFVIGTPVVLFNPPVFLRTVTSLPSGEAWNFSAACNALSCNTWGWDGVLSGGLLQWSLCPLAFLMASIFTLIKSPRLFGVTCIAFLACWAMIAGKGVMLGWYWFAFIPLLVLSLLWLIDHEKNNYVMKATIGIAVLVNAIAQAPEIYSQYKMKTQQVVALANRPQVQEEVVKHTRSQSYDLILDYWEISHVGGLVLPESPTCKVIQMTPTQFTPQMEIHPSPDDPSKPDAMQYVNSHAFVEINRLREQGTEGKSVMIILSRRLSSKHGFSDFENFFADRILPKSPVGTEYKLLSECPETTIYEIRTEPVIAHVTSGELQTK